MQEALLATLQIISWLGIVLGMLVIVNTVCGTIYNVSEKGQDFSWKRMFKGLFHAVVFYGCAAMIAMAFTILPFINTMITDVFGIQLISSDMLTTLSTTAVLSIVIAAIVAQGKYALEGVVKLLNTSSDSEKITWKVTMPEDEDIKE